MILEKVSLINFFISFVSNGLYFHFLNKSKSSVDGITEVG
jgi:hypothetical protein